jgi:hypothetical protein
MQSRLATWSFQATWAERLDWIKSGVAAQHDLGPERSLLLWTLRLLERVVS